MTSAEQLWKSLRRVRTVCFVSQSDTPGWDGVGVGSVAVTNPAESVLTHTESGIWRPSNGRETNFSNVFRWTVTGPETVSLEHLRFGPDNPVYLFDLSPHSEHEWASVRPFLCERDIYCAELQMLESGLRVYWTIDGLKKNERIEYDYSW